MNSYKIIKLDSISKGIWDKVGIFHGPVFPDEVEKYLNVNYQNVIQDDGCTYYIFVKGNKIIKEEVSNTNNIAFFINSNGYNVLNSNDKLFIKKIKNESGIYFIISKEQMGL